MKTLLITGANRGIGLEFVKQLLNHPSAKPDILIATARKLENAKELQELATKDKSLRLLQLDVTNFESFKKFSETVSEIVGDRGLTVLVNNAGILTNKDGTLEDITVESLTSQFQTNTIAPIMLTQALLPLVKKAANLQSGGISINRAALLFVSSVLGSVGSNEGTFGARYWGYRESKAALNIAARTICKEVAGDGVGVLMLHPGYVKTDMGGPDAFITPTESVQGLHKVMLGLNEKTNGAYIDYSGSHLPW